MKFPRIGMRIIKTMIAVFLSISIFLILLLIDKARGKELGNVDDTTALYNMYTPFFAGIAAAYTLHRDKKSSYQQAKIRSLGSIIGGIVGMFVIMFVEYIFKTLPSSSINKSTAGLISRLTYPCSLSSSLLHEHADKNKELTKQIPWSMP